MQVYVGMPSTTGKPYPDCIISIYNQTVKDIDLWFYNENIIVGKPVHHARNEILWNFLKTSCDYLWFVDDDNPPQFDVLEKLLRHEVDYISALVPIRHGNKYLLNVFKGGQHLTSYEGLPELIEIDNCGTGCVLMSRKLVEDMFRKFNSNPYQFRFETFGLDLDTNEPKIYNELDTTTNWKLNGKGEVWTREEYISEDLFFGREAKKLGYKIYADTTAHCKHYTKPGFLTVKYEENIVSNNTNA